MKNNEVPKIILIFLGLFSSYIFLIQVWRVTSPSYQPNSFLDHTPRKEIPVNAWIEVRNAHGKED